MSTSKLTNLKSGSLLALPCGKTEEVVSGIGSSLSANRNRPHMGNSFFKWSPVASVWVCKVVTNSPPTLTGGGYQQTIPTSKGHF